ARPRAVAGEVSPRGPAGPRIAPVLARLAVGVMVLSKNLDRGAARAAIGVALQRSRPRGVVLLGNELGRELLGEGLPLAGGIREMDSRPGGGGGQGSSNDTATIPMELSQRRGLHRG